MDWYIDGDAIWTIKTNQNIVSQQHSLLTAVPQRTAETIQEWCDTSSWDGLMKSPVNNHRTGSIRRGITPALDTTGTTLRGHLSASQRHKDQVWSHTRAPWIRHPTDVDTYTFSLVLLTVPHWSSVVFSGFNVVLNRHACLSRSLMLFQFYHGERDRFEAQDTHTQTCYPTTLDMLWHEFS